MIMKEESVRILSLDCSILLKRNRCTLACTEMTKTKKIDILRAVHVVELSWASIVIIFSFKSLHLAFRALP